MYHEFVTGPNGEEIFYEYGEYAFEGDWEKEIDDVGNGKRMRDVLTDYFYPFATAYSYFTYDEENKQYVAQSITLTAGEYEHTFTDVYVKLKDGKLHEMTYTQDGMLFTISEVGTTSVTLPTISYTVSEEQWDAIVVGSDFDNVRIDFDCRTEDGECITADQFSYAPNAMEIGNGKYLVKQDDVWYFVSYLEDVGYVGVECSKDDYTFAGTKGKQLVGKYSSFTYDEENLCYVAENIAFGDDDSCAELKIYVRNGKIVYIEQKTTAEVSGSETVVINKYEISSYGRVEDEDVTCNIPDFTIQ